MIPLEKGAASLLADTESTVAAAASEREPAWVRLIDVGGDYSARPMISRMISLVPA
jgi:hypothetical protein